MTKRIPRSVYDEVGGMLSCARMLHKVRLHERGELRDDVIANLGIGLDARCANFVRLEYPDVKARVLAGEAMTKMWSGATKPDVGLIRAT